MEGASGRLCLSGLHPSGCIRHDLVAPALYPCLTRVYMLPSPRVQATPGGRQLLDRRKQLQVHRHGERVVTALLEAGVPRGTHLQALLTQWPHLLELDAAKDWERHFCCLAAHLHASRHSLHLTPASEEQTAWEDEQRERARLGTLDSSRMALLDGVCFDYGLVDRDWEERFDELVAFVLHVGHADVLNPLSGVAPDSLLGAWARRQLTLHSLGTLPTAVEARLRAIGLLPLHASGNAPAKDAALLGERNSAHAPHALSQPGAPAATPRTQPEQAAKAPRRRQASHIGPLAAPA